VENHQGEQEYSLVKLTGDEGVEVLDSGFDLDELYAVRDKLNAEALASGHRLSELQYAVRCACAMKTKQQVVECKERVDRLIQEYLDKTPEPDRDQLWVEKWEQYAEALEWVLSEWKPGHG
jgi:hypothetical protein